MDRKNCEWRIALRNILRNCSPETIRSWCRDAGINGGSTKTLMAYAQGMSSEQIADACGLAVRSMSAVRLRALKQLRCYLVSHPSQCPKFVQQLAEELPTDGGPMPEKAR